MCARSSRFIHPFFGAPHPSLLNDTTLRVRRPPGLVLRGTPGGPRGELGRLPTGVRRQSATHGIEDAAFAALMEARLAGQIPASIEGRAFVGVRNTFLTSRYQPGQYFAPHFDGRGGSTGGGVGGAPCSEFIAVWEKN